MTVMQQEYELLRNRFMFGMRREEILSGRKPRVCLMGVNDYIAMESIEKEECTIHDDKIETGTYFRYFGIELYKSIMITDMVFGS